MSDLLARTELTGLGLEIGPLAQPKPLAPGARALYLDRFHPEEINRHYPQFTKDSVVRPHLLADAGELSMFRDRSLDFVIASDVFEHLPNPLGSILDWHRVLVPGGKLLLSVPDKRYTFDRERPRTTLSHLLWNLKEGRREIEEEHYVEWVELVEHCPEVERAERVRKLRSMAHPIHAHVWIFDDLLELFDYLEAAYGLLFRRSHMSSGPEGTFLLEKAGPARLCRGLRYAQDLVRRSFEELFTRGPRSFGRKLRRFIQRRRPEPVPYRSWMARDLARPGPRIEAIRHHPVISVITPVKDPDPCHLAAAIASVRSQTYPRWELVLVDDGSTDPRVRTILEKAGRGRRTRILRNETTRGIVAASQSALREASGEYVALLDHDDVLHPHALAEVASVLDAGVHLVYTDEDKISLEGIRVDPHFKPDWSPDLLLSMMYTCHLSVFDTARAREVGGFREGTDGSQDYDLVLRVTEGCAKVVHIPRVLYHWRQVPGSTALDPQAKPWARRAALAILEAALARRGVAGDVEEGLTSSTYRVRRRILSFPRISLIIPTRDHAAILENCLSGILERTDYPDLEIVVVDNGSVKPETARLYDRLSTDPRVLIIRRPGKFNHSWLVNQGVASATGRVLLLLNNDIEILHADWIRALLEQVQRPEVGAVGAKLLYPGGLIQHAGIVLGLGGVAGNAFCLCPDAPPRPSSYAHAVREVSAVTGACLMVRREVWDLVGGFDENFLPIAFNDVDFCLRLHDKGFSVLYTPHANLMHYESFSRGKELDSAEVERMKHRWADRIERDPFYNPHLTRTKADFSVGCGQTP